MEKAMKSFAQPIRLLILTIIPTWLTACGTIPDLEPYAQATASLHSATSSSHDLLYKELSALKGFYPDDKDFASFPDRFSKAWHPRAQTLEAMVSYSDALAAIAQAAKDGQKNTEALVQSLQTFVGAAGGPIGLAASPAGAKIFTTLSSAAISIRATQDLDKAINAADPVIQEVSDLIIADFTDLENLLTQDNLESDLEAAIKHSYQKEFGADPSYRKQLISLQQQAVAEIQNEQIKTPLNPTELKRAEEKLSKLNDWLAATNLWHDKQTHDLKEMRSRFASHRIILAKAKKGIQEWRTIHMNLAMSMKQGKQRPNFRLLLNTAMEIRTILNEGGKQ